MSHVWHNPKSTTHKTLIVDNQRVFVGSASDGDLPQIDSLLAAGQSPLPVLGAKSVAIGDVKLTRIESDAGSPMVTISYTRDGQDRFTMVALPRLDDREAALSALSDALSLSSTTVKASPLRAAKMPLFSLAMVGAATSVLSSAATELATGGDALFPVVGVV